MKTVRPASSQIRPDAAACHNCGNFLKSQADSAARRSGSLQGCGGPVRFDLDLTISFRARNVAPKHAHGTDMQLKLDSPTSMTIGITEACPMHCRHCYADCCQQPKEGELGIETWIAMIGALAEQGIVQLYIEGGEPLLKPGILDLLRAASPKMMTMLRTHGSGLDRGMAASLRDAGLGRALVDVMGGNAIAHDAQSGMPGSFAQSCAAVRSLVESGIPTDVLVILTRHTAPELQSILDLAAGLGAARVGVLRLYPLGRAKHIWSELALPLAEQMAALASLLVPQGMELMQSWHPKDRNCCWQGAAINAFGRAIGCMYLREYVDFGDATQIPYGEIWRTHPLYRELRSGHVDASCAASAGGGDGSKGGCRSTAYAWTGSWTAPDPFDKELNRGTDLAQLPSRLLGA